MSSEFICHTTQSIFDPRSGYGALLLVSQMWETEAAGFHKVSLRSIQNFIRGRRAAPEGVITEIGDLVRRMHHAADALSRTLTPETEGRASTRVGG